MEIRLVKHEQSGLGYAQSFPSKGIMKVRFWNNVDLPLSFPTTSFDKGHLEDLGVIDNTKNNSLFT